MIIYENALDKAAEAETHRETADSTLDPPPTYSPAQPEPPTSSPELPAVQSTAKPSNFTSIIRQHDSIKGNYTIDPTLYIPFSLLPPVEPGESEKERKNLKLESRHGSIDVKIFLAGGKSAGSEGRTTMVIRSTHGRVGIKLNTAATSRNPFHLTAHSTHNSITLYLPRSYQGLLTTTTGHDSHPATFSAQLAQHITSFSENDSTKVGFVGDFSGWKEGDGGWSGDEVTLITKHGKIKVLYVDDAQPMKASSLLSRVLRLSG